jgi:hypothetical protein
VKIVLVILMVVFMAMLWSVLVGFPVKWLWNWLLPTLFNFPKIGFWQAVGVVFLCRCLFGGGLSGGKAD